MHRDRNHGTWPELKAKRQNKFENSKQDRPKFSNPKFDDAPLESLDTRRNQLDDEAWDAQKIKKDRAAKQLADVENMFKNMSDYDDKQERS